MLYRDPNLGHLKTPFYRWDDWSQPSELDLVSEVSQFLKVVSWKLIEAHRKVYVQQIIKTNWGIAFICLIPQANHQEALCWF